MTINNLIEEVTNSIDPDRFSKSEYKVGNFLFNKSSLSKEDLEMLERVDKVELYNSLREELDNIFFKSEEYSMLTPAVRREYIASDIAYNKALSEIKYDPNEAYERGYTFYHGFPGYGSGDMSTLAVGLTKMVKTVEAGVAFPLSTYAHKFTDKGHKLGGRRQPVRIVIFPEAKDIKVSSRDDLYTRSEQSIYVAKHEVAVPNFIMRSMPSDFRKISPSIADSIENRNHNHNEQVINLRKGNFYIEYDETVSKELRKAIDEINSKLEKPDTSVINTNSDYKDVPKNNKDMPDTSAFSEDFFRKMTKYESEVTQEEINGRLRSDFEDADKIITSFIRDPLSFNAGIFENKPIETLGSVFGSKGTIAAIPLADFILTTGLDVPYNKMRDIGQILYSRSKIKSDKPLTIDYLYEEPGTIRLPRDKTSARLNSIIKEAIKNFESGMWDDALKKDGVNPVEIIKKLHEVKTTEDVYEILKKIC